MRVHACLALRPGTNVHLTGRGCTWLPHTPHRVLVLRFTAAWEERARAQGEGRGRGRRARAKGECKAMQRPMHSGSLAVTPVPSLQQGVAWKAGARGAREGTVTPLTALGSHPCWGSVVPWGWKAATVSNAHPCQGVYTRTALTLHVVARPNCSSRLWFRLLTVTLTSTEGLQQWLRSKAVQQTT